MKKGKLIFFLMPIIQVLSSARYFKSHKQIISSIIFIISSFLIALLIYEILSVLFSKYTKSNKYFIPLSLLVLAVIDQGHKFILEFTGLNCNIIGELFKIKQTPNENQMAILNHFNITLNLTLVICLKIFMLIIWVFCIYKLKNPNFKIGFLLLAASQATSIFDSIYRGYVLDSFYYYKLVCYDIKDYYVDAGIALILLTLLFTNKKCEDAKKVTDNLQ